jgi:hypothetical protein
MNISRFDSLSRSFSARLSRRAAIQASGVAAGFATASPFRAAAQDIPATPDPLTNDATFLFVQSATSGTFAANPAAGTPSAGGTPTAGGGADYLLTLSGHTGNTIFFSDRPERIFGEAPTERFLDGLGFAATNPPNAALVTNDENGNEDVLVVELFDPSYDADAGTVTYGVNLLSDYEGGLDFVASRQRGEDLAPEFGAVSLFIDDCSDVSGCLDYPANAKDSVYVGPLPDGTPSGQCWSWSSFSCNPCSGWSQQDYDNACNNAYPDQCNGLCFVDLG